MRHPPSPRPAPPSQSPFLETATAAIPKPTTKMTRAAWGSSYMEDPDYEPTEDQDDELPLPSPPPPPLPHWSVVKKRTSAATANQHSVEPVTPPSTNNHEDENMENMEIPPTKKFLSFPRANDDGARRLYDQTHHRTSGPPAIGGVSHPVHPNWGIILQSINNKHGDISKDCRFKSNYVIAIMLEGVCMIIEDLQGKKLETLDINTLVEYDVFLKDAEKMNFNVKWLRLQVVQLLDAVNSFIAANDAARAKTELEKKIEDIERDIEGGRADVEKLIYLVQERERELALRKHEGENLSVKIAIMKKKYQHLVGKPLTINGLL